MNNRVFQWIILVPRLENLREITDLPQMQRHRLMDEIAQASSVMRTLFTPDKLNVAALGNQIAQLHVHVIARFTSDAAWPDPVWGKAWEAYGDPEPIRQRLIQAFALSALQSCATLTP